MDGRSKIKFIKPCLYEFEKQRILTPEYTTKCFNNGIIVQINLDNCSLQRMEELSPTSTLDDVERVGLLPLVDLLQNGEVSLTAIGVNEMPDLWVKKSITAYHNFCNLFWPGHVDDPDATSRKYDPTSKKSKVCFKELSDDARTTLGMHYISMLQIQNIKINYASHSPEEKLEIYINSMIGFINIISAYELEIAKYAFWEIDSNTINRLPSKISKRRKYIKQNFYRNGSSLDKCRWHAFDAAMDLHWLIGANFSEDLEAKIRINNKNYKIDHWVGTNDHKLYHIAQDIHHIYHEKSTLKALSMAREKELSEFQYWKNVDNISSNILNFRRKSLPNISEEYTDKIDLAVNIIERDLYNYFLKNEKN
ncbi:hypothetical protein [Pantoea ananatis]|uniref:hypothetical protein n=1 Tax=Pantoea ananas TaxID=553 RepID=UPI00351D7A01